MNTLIMNFRRNMKAAFTTVKSNFKEYVCFVVALTMVQMLFCVLSIAVFNDGEVEAKVYSERGYDYHCTITGVDQADVNLLMELYNVNRVQDRLKFTYRTSGSEFRVVFEDDFEACYQLFSEAVKNMNARYDHVSLQVTPLYDHDRGSSDAWGLLLPLLGATALLSYFLVMALFRIRLNHFKFTYGVYMTYGADRKKLLAAAFYEMLLLVFLTFLPAVALSYGCAALLYLPRGSAFSFYFAPLPITLFCSLLSSLLALLLPVRLLSRTPPVRVLKAEDNSNLVSGARKSLFLVKKGVARAELLGLWRFRRYLAALLLSTVTFASLFFAGCCIADAYKADSASVSPSFTVKTANEARYAQFIGFFGANAKNNGVDATVEKNAASPFAPGGSRENDVPPALAVPSSLTVPGFFEDLYGGRFALTDALEIRAYDEDARDCLEKVYGYAVEGDVALPLTDPDAVIVSSSFASSKALKVRPGDTVLISVNYYPLPSFAAIPELFLDAGSRSKHGVYVFKECRVAAVIEDYADLSGMLLYLPVHAENGEESLYEQVMGSAPSFTEARIYVPQKDDEAIASRIIEDYIADYGGAEFVSHYATVGEEAARAKNRPGLIMTLSVMILAVFPLAGIFSQILFYSKRRTELDVLRAVGAVKKDLRRIFLVDGAAVAVLSGAFYTALCFLLSRLLTSYLNSALSALFSGGAGKRVYGAIFPAAPFVAGLVLTVVFAALSALIPAILYFRSIDDHVASSFTDSEE